MEGRRGAEAHRRRADRQGRGPPGPGQRGAGPQGARRAARHEGGEAGGPDDPRRGDRAGQRDDGAGLQGRADLAEQEGQERHGRDGRAAEPGDAGQPPIVPGRRGQGGDRLREGGLRGDRAALRRAPGVDPGRRQADRERQGALAVLEPQREHDRPGGDRGDGRGRAGAQAPEHGAPAGDQGQGVGHPLRAVRGRVQDAVPGRRRALRARPAAPAPGPGDLQPDQGHVEPRHRRAPAAAGRPDPAGHRRQLGRHPGLDPADPLRRERRPADPRPDGRAARPEQDRDAAGHPDRSGAS